MNTKHVTINILFEAGPISVTFESSEGDLLYGISIAEFAQKVLDLANYIGPEDVELETEIAGPSIQEHIAALGQTSPRKRADTPIDVIEEDNGDIHYEAGDERVTQKAMIPRTKDEILRKALLEEGSEGWS